MFLLTGRVLRDPASWLPLLFESMAAGFTGFSISKKSRVKEQQVATSRECSYHCNGEKLRGENLLENCTVHGFRKKMCERGLCVCRHVKRDKTGSLFNKNEKRNKNATSKIIKNQHFILTNQHTLTAIRYPLLWFVLADLTALK